MALAHQAGDRSGRLLAWWEQAGRRDPAQKPWMVTVDGRWPRAGEPLDPYGVWAVSDTHRTLTTNREG